MTASQTDTMLLIADDHIMVRTGLILSLELDFGYKNVIEASSCAEVISKLRSHNPSHMIIDLVFKDGHAMEILPAIVERYSSLQILVYSMMPETIYGPVLRKYGIQCYLNKESDSKLTNSMLYEFLFKKLAFMPGNEIADTNPFSKLSAREVSVLHYLLKGLSITEISQNLNLHKNTISTLKNRILEKTGVRNMKDLFNAAALHDITF